MRAADRLAGARFLLARLAFRLQEIPVEDVVDERRFAGTGNAGDAGENAERNVDVDVLEIVLARAGDLDRPRGDLRRDFGIGMRFSPGEVIAG